MMCPRLRTRYGYGRMKKVQAQDSESCSNDGDQHKPRRKGMRRKGAVQVQKLCEKRRRDKINRKVRALQDLIPNCTKVDKASVLDEAIEYLKYLKLQLQIMPIIFGGSCVAPTHNMMLGMDAQQFFTSPYGVYGIGTRPQMPPP